LGNVFSPQVLDNPSSKSKRGPVTFGCAGMARARDLGKKGRGFGNKESRDCSWGRVWRSEREFEKETPNNQNQKERQKNENKSHLHRSQDHWNKHRLGSSHHDLRTS
jgi:hypothetical protein